MSAETNENKVFVFILCRAASYLLQNRTVIVSTRQRNSFPGGYTIPFLREKAPPPYLNIAILSHHAITGLPERVTFVAKQKQNTHDYNSVGQWPR